MFLSFASNEERMNSVFYFAQISVWSTAMFCFLSCKEVIEKCVIKDCVHHMFLALVQRDKDKKIPSKPTKRENNTRSDINNENPPLKCVLRSNNSGCVSFEFVAALIPYKQSFFPSLVRRENESKL